MLHLSRGCINVYIPPVSNLLDKQVKVYLPSGLNNAKASSKVQVELVVSMCKYKFPNIVGA